MVRFFIDRPIFAWVIAIAVSLLGLLAILILPVDRYPQIAPPTITIRATYTGASSQTVENAVTQVIEQSQQSLDHLMYMTSTSASDGSAQVNLVFATGTNPDTAQVQVQNQLQAAMATLPQAVQQNGLTITKSSGSIFEVLSFTSEDGSMDNFDVANFMEARIDDQISRVSGVGNIQPIGQEYAMRIWLDPEKMRQYALMPSDIETALQAQNTDVSAGELGGQPALKGQQLDATVTARSRLHTPEQFAQVVLKADAIWATWPRSAWARRATTASAPSTASRRPRWALNSMPVRTRSPCPRPSMRGFSSCRSTGRMATPPTWRSPPRRS